MELWQSHLMHSHRTTHAFYSWDTLHSQLCHINCRTHGFLLITVTHATTGMLSVTSSNFGERCLNGALPNTGDIMARSVPNLGNMAQAYVTQCHFLSKTLYKREDPR